MDTSMVEIVPGYETLEEVLDAAYAQATVGKGAERHANAKPFTEQPIMTIGRMVGYGYPLGQAMKKAQESIKLLSLKGVIAAQAELLGAINYLAAAHILMTEASADESDT